MGSTLGPMVAGLMLAANQVNERHALVSHYAYQGYVAVMLVVGAPRHPETLAFLFLFRSS